MKIFPSLAVIGFVVLLASPAKAFFDELDEEFSPEVTYQVLQSTLDIARKKGLGTSSYEKHIESIEKDARLNELQKQKALNSVYSSLKQQLKVSSRSTLGGSAWSKFVDVLFKLMPTYEIVPESAFVLKVSFVLRNDGSISNPRQLSSSGITKLDQEILAKLKEIRLIPGASEVFTHDGRLHGQNDCFLRLDYMPGEVVLLCFSSNGSGGYSSRPYTITFLKERCFPIDPLSPGTWSSQGRSGLSIYKDRYEGSGSYAELIGPTLKGRFR